MMISCNYPTKPTNETGAVRPAKVPLKLLNNLPSSSEVNTACGLECGPEMVERLIVGDGPDHSRKAIRALHADTTPETLPPSTCDNSLTHDMDLHQSIEWIAKAVVTNVPLTPPNLVGRSMDKRLPGPRQIDLDIISL